jgi:hypothetical protein
MAGTGESRLIFFQCAAQVGTDQAVSLETLIGIVDNCRNIHPEQDPGSRKIIYLAKGIDGGRTRLGAVAEKTDHSDNP